MELFEAIKNRRTIRAYQKREVEDAKIMQILDAAIRAPSAGNLQTWEFIIVKEKETKKKLADASYGQDFLTEAPVVIVVCANKRRANKYGERGENLYCIQDCAAATENMLLSAHALGLGVGWIGAFDESEVSKILNLPEHVRPLSIHPVGYPAEEPEFYGRLQLEKVLHREKF